jgi:hypothetical protein
MKMANDFGEAKRSLQEAQQLLDDVHAQKRKAALLQPDANDDRYAKKAADARAGKGYPGNAFDQLSTGRTT